MAPFSPSRKRDFSAIRTIVGNAVVNHFDMSVAHISVNEVVGLYVSMHDANVVHCG